MGAEVLDSNGERCPLVMGSYGIGVERLMAACIESSHDEKGIIWHPAIAPFQVVVTPTDTSDSAILEYAEDVYDKLLAHKIDVLLDDRSERAGVKFAESELIGIPYRLTVGKKLVDGKVELLTRKGPHHRRSSSGPSSSKNCFLAEQLLVPGQAMVKALSDYKQAKDLLLDAAAVLSQMAAEERNDQGLASTH
jgi:hypothetical protein